MKAAIRTAAKAPVAICWLLIAGEEEEAALADAVEEPEAPPELPDVVAADEPEEEAAVLMVVAVAPARDSLAETRAAVAFFVPHFSLLVHCC